MRVIIGSDDNDIGTANKIADYLVNDREDVLAVVGHNASDVSKSASEMYQGRLLMISPTSFALNHAGINETKEKNYIFTMAAGIDILVSKLIEHMRDNKTEGTNPRVLICFDSRAIDQVLIKNSFRAKNNEVKFSISSIKCNFNEPSEGISNILASAEADGVTHLFLGPHVNTIKDGFYMIRESEKDSAKKLKLYASPTLYTDITLEENGEAVEGLVLGAYWHPDLKNEESVSFYKEAKARWKENGVTWRTALAYDATKIIIEGMKKITSDKRLTHKQLREKLRDEVTKSRKSGVTGKIVFNENNGRREEQLIHLMRVSKDPQSNKYKFELIESEK